MQLKFDCIHHTAVRNKSHCVVVIRLYSQYMLTVCGYSVVFGCVSEWIVIVTFTMGQRDVDNSLLSPILV